MMKLICINCPFGCEINVEEKGDELLISGNNCKAGEKYARNEVTCPKRMITSSAYVYGNKRVSCKSREAIDKKLIFSVMEEIHKLRLNAPIRINDVLIKNVLNSGVDIIATKNID